MGVPAAQALLHTGDSIASFLQIFGIWVLLLIQVALFLGLLLSIVLIGGYLFRALVVPLRNSPSALQPIARVPSRARCGYHSGAAIFDSESY